MVGAYKLRSERIQLAQGKKDEPKIRRDNGTVNDLKVMMDNNWIRYLQNRKIWKGNVTVKAKAFNKMEL